MANVKKKLSQRAALSAKPAEKRYEIVDTSLSGFRLIVHPTGKKTWIMRLWKNNKQKVETIGNFPDVSFGKAKQKANDKKLELGSGKKTIDKKISFARLIDLQIEKHIKSHCSEKHYDNRKSLYQNYIITSALANVPHDEITRGQIIDLMQEVKDAGITDTKPDGAPSTANKVHSLIRESYENGFRNEWIECNNPALRIKRYKEHARVRIMTKKETKALLKVFTQRLGREPGETNYSHPSAIQCLRYIYLSGVRLSEATSLRWEHINFDNNIITYPVASGRSQKSYHAYLTNQAAQFLKKLGPKKEGLVFPSGTGKELRNMARTWISIRKEAKISDLTIHDLRHNIISVGIAAGIQKEVMSRMVGQTDPASANRYAHLDIGFMGKGIKKVDNPKDLELIYFD